MVSGVDTAVLDGGTSVVVGTGAEVVVGGGAGEEGGLAALVGTLAPVLPIGRGAGSPAPVACGAMGTG
ncbi:MAG: hypothetical protein ACRDR6_30500, partial [Pseudonocardiaceae bacterium]